MKVINRQARFDYDVRDRLEVGIVLTGAEAKSAQKGSVDLGQSFCKIRDDQFGRSEVWVHNLHIYPYVHADNTGYDPKRTRKLLLHQKEILALKNKIKQYRMLLVPTAMYTKSGKIKLEIGLARGKRKYEKREAIKKRDLERDLAL